MLKDQTGGNAQRNATMQRVTIKQVKY